MSEGWQWPPGWRAIRRAVFARYGHACWRCGAYADTVDHIVPRVLGGGHNIENLRPSCGPCNYSSGASVGNRLRPPLTGAQKRAIGARRRTAAPPPARPWRTSREW